MKPNLLFATASCAFALSRLFAEETMLIDVAYREGLSTPKLDFYIPATPRFPTIVHVYGSGWRSGSGKSSAPIAEVMRRHGIGCILVSHRLAPNSIVQQAEDVAAAFAWAKAHVANAGGDPGKIFLSGHSTGGQLVALVAVDPTFLAPYHLTNDDIAGVIGLSAPLDLLPRPDGHGYGNRMSGPAGKGIFPSTPEEINAISPLQHLNHRLSRLLLLIGSDDFPMLADDARAFAAKAREMETDVSIDVIPGKDHMGMIRALTVENDPVLLRVLTFVQGKSAATKD
jgi:acetyl esterase/lipase